MANTESVTILGYDALKARFARLGKMDGRLLAMLGAAAVREARTRAPRKTSNLRRTISSSMQGTDAVRVQATANYAAYVEFGTRPHEITPRAKMALRWAGSSADVRLTGSPRKGATSFIFAMRVHHPGTQPHPYLVPGAQAAIAGAGLANEVKAVWNNIPAVLDSGSDI